MPDDQAARLIELAWAAGFFDGEGGIYSRTHGGKPSVAVAMSLSQVRLEPLQRFQAAVGGLGNLYVSYRSQSRRSNQQDINVWTCGNYEHVQAIVCMLWNFLSEPKREQVEVAMRHRQEYNRAIWQARIERQARLERLARERADRTRKSRRPSSLVRPD